MISPTEAADLTAKPILEFGRAWMMDPGTQQRAQSLGLTGRFGFWVNGRAGVLGTNDPAVVAAAIGFMAPSAVREYWDARPDALTPWAAALEWFDAGAVWARTALASMDDARVERLATLARQVAENADLSIGALFAGSLAIPLPGDAAGDAGITLNVLRELRGAAHLAAVHAAGLGPHGAIMSTDDPIRGGAAWSEGFGWTAPHPTPDHDARARAEELTTTIAASAFTSLDGAERAEFAELVIEARSLI